MSEVIFNQDRECLSKLAPVRDLHIAQMFLLCGNSWNIISESTINHLEQSNG